MTTELTTPITRIKSVSKDDQTYELGGLFKNIYLDVDDKNNKLKNYTLEDLYNELKSYFTNGNFIYYSNKLPKSSQIKIWFDTTEKEEGTE